MDKYEFFNPQNFRIKSFIFISSIYLLHIGYALAMVIMS